MWLWYGNAPLEWWQTGLMWVATIVFLTVIIWLAWALLSDAAHRHGRNRRHRSAH